MLLQGSYAEGLRAILSVACLLGFSVSTFGVHVPSVAVHFRCVQKIEGLCRFVFDGEQNRREVFWRPRETLCVFFKVF